jgi:ribosomal protein S18 acetylase RimI-like enzyme
MTSVIIREAEEQDMPEIIGLTMELIGALDDKKGIEPDSVLQNLKTLLSDNQSMILIAESGGSICGLINLAFRPTLIHKDRSAVIDELVVFKCHREKGVGSELIQAAVNKCREQNCSEIEVSTEKDNTEAVEFYKKLGFVEKGAFLELDI